MRNKVRLMLCGFVIVGMMITSISAQPGWGATANPLGLTTEQMEQIQAIALEREQELLPIWSSLQAKNLELQRLMWNRQADPVVVEAKTREVGDLQAKMQRKMLERSAAIRELLTEEQQAQYDARGMGFGFGRGPCGLGLGPGRGGGFGWRRGPGRGARTPYGLGFNGPGWGRGPCGMGLGRAGWRTPTQ